MSEHAWVKENIASYLAGGLDGVERERFEQHTAGCAECARALADARSVDGALEALFTSERPQAMLEDWLIEGLRAESRPRPWRRLPRMGKLLATAAALVFLTASGAGLSALLEEDQIPSPGTTRNALKQLALLDPTGLNNTGSMAFIGGTEYTGEETPAGRSPVKNLALEAAKFRLLTIKAQEAQERLNRLDRMRQGGDGRGLVILAEDYGAAVLTRDKYVQEMESARQAFSPDGKALLGAPKAEVPPGHRAMGLRVSQDAITGGYTSLPGSHVDVIWTRRGSDGQTFSKTLLQNVQVLAADSQKQRNEEGMAVPGSVVTLALSPEDARRAALAKENGTMHLVLRSSGDNTRDEQDATTVWQLLKDGKTNEKAERKGYFKPADTFAMLDANKGSAGMKEGEGPGKGAKEPAKQPPPEGGKAKIGEPKKQPQPAPVTRKIIRSGDVEFEVDSFDAAVATVVRLVTATKGGFVATVNSDKLPNGKVRGSVVVRVPPEHLDPLLLALRKELGKAGELKSQRIGSQDVTKKYTDLESRLRAARTMEERLLKIIRDGKGEIKDLLLAEKELGVWRTRSEEFEGELRYYANLVALSTLTITLAEKEIRAPAQVSESERVQAGIEVEDVDKAQREALAAVAAAKGRVVKAELKQHAAGQFNALLQFEVAPDAAGPLRDRLRQLGTMVRLEIDRGQRSDNGGPVPLDTKVKRGDTVFVVSLYNLANVAPRETVTLTVAAADVAATYRALREAVGKVKGRVLIAQLNEKDRQNVTAQLDFDIRRVSEGAVRTALTDAGEVLSRQVGRAPESENVTDAKLLFKVELVSAVNVPARETVTLGIEVPDVDAALTLFSTRVKDAGGRTVQVQLGQERTGRVTAHIVYDVPLAAAAGLIEKLKGAGQVRIQRMEHNAQAPQGKLALARLDVTLSNGELLLPQEEGLGARLRSGLSFSLRGLSVSASWLIVALLFVLPWGLLIYAVVWLARRLRGGNRASPAVAAPQVVEGAAAPRP